VDINLPTIAITLITIMLILGLMGFTFERVAQARTKITYPELGTMVDVGGHRLHMVVTGKEHDGPTVILEAGQGGFSTHWTNIQSSLSEHVRVVSYDRAGYGWSETDRQPRDLTRNAHQLRKALDELEIEPPYLLVSHSMGGIFSTVFQTEYAEDVIGMVLVDPSPPDLFDNLPQDMVDRMKSVARMMQALQVASNFGVLRVINPFASVVADMPDPQRSATIAFSTSPSYIASYLDENDILLTLPQSMPPRASLHDLPLVVLSTNTAPEGQTMPDGIVETLHRLHEEWANESTNGKWLIMDGANHYSVIGIEPYTTQIVSLIFDMIKQSASVS